MTDAEAKAALQCYKEKIPVGKYRHFKGNYYEVLALANNSETMEVYVVYQALYGDNGVWVRPASMWNETVNREGHAYKRFTFVGSSGELE